MTSLKNTILNELRVAVEESRSSDRTLEERVHATRRRCKRIRAYLRLLPACVAKPARRAREDVRSAATLLSRFRDAHVMAQMCRAMRDELETKTIAADLELQDTIGSFGDAGNAAENGPEAELERAARLLKKGQRVVAKLNGTECRNAMLRALQQTHKHGRQAIRRLLDDPSLEHYHDLRKITKQLYYQCQHVAAEGDVPLATVIQQSRELEEELGDALNFSILARHLSELHSHDADEPLKAHLIASAETRMKRLFQRAVPMACQLFFETSKQFRQRLA